MKELRYFLETFTQNSLFPYIVYTNFLASLRFLKSKKKKWTCATWGSIGSCAAGIAFIVPPWDNVRTVHNYWSDTLANRTCRSRAESRASHGKSIIVTPTCAWRSYVGHCQRTRGVLVKSVLQTIAGEKKRRVWSEPGKRPEKRRWREQASERRATSSLTRWQPPS